MEPEPKNHKTFLHPKNQYPNPVSDTNTDIQTTRSSATVERGKRTQFRNTCSKLKISNFFLCVLFPLSNPWKREFGTKNAQKLVILTEILDQSSGGREHYPGVWGGAAVGLRVVYRFSFSIFFHFPLASGKLKIFKNLVESNLTGVPNPNAFPNVTFGKSAPKHLKNCSFVFQWGQGHGKAVY